MLQADGSLYINPETGQPYMSTGYYVNNSTIQLIIKNQPIGVYTDNGYPVKLYYNLRVKILSGYTHYENGVNVTEYYDWREGGIFNSGNLPEASDGQYTVLTNTYNGEGYDKWGLPLNSAIAGFQVEAMLGSIQKDPYYPAGMNFTRFVGQTSDWSDTQTLNKPDTNYIVIPQTPTPTATPDIPRNAPYLDPIYYLIPVSVILAVAMAAILLYRRHRKTASLKQLPFPSLFGVSTFFVGPERVANQQF
jgi:carbohydrate-binding DOMON domain-containing protein